jgi:hypothetical protein
VTAAGAARGRVGGTGLGWALGLQVAAFVAMETGERAMVGLPPSVLVHSLTFWLGLALQLPVAWLATRLLGAVEEVTFRLVRHARRRPIRPARRLPIPVWVVAAATATLASRTRSRAPPARRAI